jgi:hypothetical protein
MSGIVMRIPAELIGAGALIELLQPYVTNLDEPVSSRVAAEDVMEIATQKLPDGKVH